MDYDRIFQGECIMAIIQPLDFENVIIDKLIGTSSLEATIFIFLAFAVIAAVAGRFRMPGGAFMMMLIVFSFIFSSTFLGGSGIFRFVVLMIVAGMAYIFARSLNRSFS